MAKKVTEVIEYFENLYKNNAIYCWGFNGEIINQTSIDRAYNLYKSATYNREYYNNKLKEGLNHIGADCSGAMFPMSGFDTTAQNYYNKCQTKGSISNIPKNKACLVFKGSSVSSISHIGFYCGNGYVIEMKSSKDNCIKDVVDNKGWKWYGIPTWIDYSSDVSSSTSFEKCVDVSSYQGTINWSQVKSAGINKAILKVIRKDLSVDKKFEEYWKGCASANVEVIGVYNYSYATTVTKAKTDAQKVLDVLNGRKVKIWLDVEDKCQQGLGSLLKDIINAYQEVITSNGYEFGVYTGMSFYNSYLKSYASQIKCKDFWIARYYNGYNKMNVSINPNEQYNPKLSTGLSEIYGWQYTSSGQVSGISGNVDLSVIYQNTSSNNNSSTSSISQITESAITLMGKINTTSSNLNIRSAPNSSSSKIGSYKKGEIVRLAAKTSNGWYRTDKGYISGDYVIGAIGKVYNCSKLNIRSSPEVISTNKIGVLNVNDQVQLLKKDSNWYKIKTNKNIVGYVSSKYITII